MTGDEMWRGFVRALAAFGLFLPTSASAGVHETTGTGAVIEMREVDGASWPTVVSVIPGSPADKAQMRPGAHIFKIGSWNTRGRDAAEVQRRLDTPLFKARRVWVDHADKDGVTRHPVESGFINTIAPVRMLLWDDAIIVCDEGDCFDGPSVLHRVARDPVLQSERITATFQGGELVGDAIVEHELGFQYGVAADDQEKQSRYVGGFNGSGFHGFGTLSYILFGSVHDVLEGQFERGVFVAKAPRPAAVHRVGPITAITGSGVTVGLDEFDGRSVARVKRILPGSPGGAYPGPRPGAAADVIGADGAINGRYYAGLANGNLVFQIDDWKTAGHTAAEVQARLDGPANTGVVLRIHFPDRRYEVNLARIRMLVWDGRVVDCDEGNCLDGLSTVYRRFPAADPRKSQKISAMFAGGMPVGVATVDTTFENDVKTRYVGTLDGDLYEGRGTLTERLVEIDGTFRAGLPEGPVQLRYVGTTLYPPIVVNTTAAAGRYMREVTIDYPDGRRYVGEWNPTYGNPSGKGTMTLASGGAITAESWLSESRPTGAAVIRAPNGETLTADLSRDMARPDWNGDWAAHRDGELYRVRRDGTWTNTSARAAAAGATAAEHDHVARAVVELAMEKGEEMLLEKAGGTSACFDERRFLEEGWQYRFIVVAAPGDLARPAGEVRNVEGETRTVPLVDLSTDEFGWWSVILAGNGKVVRLVFSDTGFRYGGCKAWLVVSRKRPK